MAEERDRQRERAVREGQGEGLGRMHGVPIALWDGVDWKGKITMLGMAHMT